MGGKLKRVVLVVALSVCAFAKDGMLFAQDVPTLQQIIQAIEARNAKILHIHVKGCRLDREVAPSDTGPWTPLLEGPLLASRLVVDGKPNSRFRVDIERMVTEWRGGAAPWFDSRVSVGWDGTAQVVVSHSQRAMKSADDETAPRLPTQYASIHPTISERLFDDMLFHGPVDNNFGDELFGGQVVASLQYLIKNNVNPYLSWDTVTIPGLRLLRIDYNGEDESPSIWLDADRGYTLRKFVFVRNTDPTTGKATVSRYGMVQEVTEAAPGIWYPKKSWIVRETHDSDPSRAFVRITSTSDSVVINDPTINDDDWHPQIPPLYGVTDHVNNEVWRAAPDGQVYREKMDQRLGEARAAAIAARNRAATQPAAVVAVNTTPQSSNWPALAIGLTVGLTFLLLASVFARLYKSRTLQPPTPTILLLISLASVVVSSSPAVSQSPPTTRQSDPQVSSAVRHAFSHLTAKRLNCGLEATYLLLAWEERSLPFDDLVSALRTGDDYSRLVTLSDIADVLNRQGIRSKSFLAKDARTVFNSINSTSVVRLHRTIGGRDIGHYVVVVPQGLDFIVLDGGLAVRTVVRSDAHLDSQLRAASGEFLRVEQKTFLVTNSVEATFPKRAIHAGSLPYNTGPVKVRIPVNNLSNQPLEFAAAAGCCSSFVEFDGPNVIPAQTQQDLVAVIRRERLAPGLNHRLLELTTNDPNIPKVAIEASVEIAESTSPETLRIFPSGVDLGRRQIGATFRPQVTVFIPQSVVAGPPKVVVSDTENWTVAISQPESTTVAGKATWIVELTLEHLHLGHSALRVLAHCAK